MIRLHIIRTIIFALIGFAIGYGILATSPKVYEGRVQVVLGTQQQNQRFYSSTLNEDVAMILQSGLATNPQTEAQILRGEGVFRDALQRVATATSKPQMVTQFDDYYRMYDVQSTQDASAALIKARAYSAADATALANAVAEAYNERRQANQRETVARALKYLNDQIGLAQKDLDAAENVYQRAKEESGSPDMAATIARDVEYQSQLRAAIDGATAELAGTESQIAEAEDAINHTNKYEEGDSSSQKNATLQQLQNQLAEFERQKQTLLVDYYEDAIPVRLINGSIASVKKQIADLKKNWPKEETVVNKRPDSIRRQLQAQLAQLKINKQGTEKKLSVLQQTMSAHLQKVNTLPAETKKVIDLARDVDIKDGNYKRLKVQAEDLKNRTEATATAAQIVYDAVPDETPVLPKPPVVYVVSVLGGAILGLLVSFAIEAMRLRIYSSTQLQELTGLPVVGVIHDLPSPTARKLLTSVREPNPLIAESYRFLAFAAMNQKTEGPRRILLTGVDNKAGCSTTAAQFATALAHTGARVLLVDCALEDPTITKVFGLEQKSGVSDILSQTQLPGGDSSVGYETATPNLRVLPVGTEAKNAIKVAPTQNINGMIAALSAAYDVVVIDSLPCLMSSDAARLVPYVDEVYLVTSAKTANMRNVAAAIDVLTLASAASIKFVVTKGSRGEEAVMRQTNLASARI